MTSSPSDSNDPEFANRLEIQPEAGGESAASGQIRVQIEGVKTVVRVEQVDEAQGNFRVATREAIAGQQIVLPEISGWQPGVLLIDRLVIPDRFPPRKEAAGMRQIRAQ